MKRRIISLGLLFVIVALSVSCEKTSVSEVVSGPVVVSFSDAGHISAANEYAKAVGGDFVEYSSASDAVVALVNGKADYLVLDEYTGDSFEKQTDNICFYKKCEYNIEYSACFSLANEELCQQFNEAFEALKNDGTITEIKNAAYNNVEYIASEPAKVKGVLTMVCDPVFEHRLYFENDEVKGVEVNIAKEVCAYLGYRLVIKTSGFEDMFLSLDNAEADFIMSCVERTDQRAEHYLFSDVYTTYDYNVYRLK